MIIEKAMEQGYLRYNDALLFYTYTESCSRSLSSLVEKGYLIEKEAPPMTDLKKIWFPTEKAIEEL